MDVRQETPRLSPLQSKESKESKDSLVLQNLHSDKVIVTIFSYLAPKDIANLELASKQQKQNVERYRKYIREATCRYEGALRARETTRLQAQADFERRKEAQKQEILAIYESQKQELEDKLAQLENNKNHELARAVASVPLLEPEEEKSELAPYTPLIMLLHEFLECIEREKKSKWFWSNRVKIFNEEKATEAQISERLSISSNLGFMASFIAGFIIMGAMPYGALSVFILFALSPVVGTFIGFLAYHIHFDDSGTERHDDAKLSSFPKSSALIANIQGLCPANIGLPLIHKSNQTAGEAIASVNAALRFFKARQEQPQQFTTTYTPRAALAPA